ncbi:Vacuolar protein sorting-associated protein 53 -like protein [Halotydeus destructor]|nr:Vacuolar protein sorting-associated protein 53 -like protein [Halotydeus destructor]
MAAEGEFAASRASGDEENSDDDAFPVTKLTPEVQEAIEHILPSDDPLDKIDFNPIDYINQVFPNQQSLTNLDDVLSRLKQRISQLDSEISSVVRGQNNVENEGRAALLESRQVIVQLTTRIREMKEQAKKSELMVNEITSDIKQLDNAKKNLTSSIIMLNNLHILVEGVEKLEESASNRQYGQTAAILQSALDVLGQLEQYRHIPHIEKLSVKVNETREKLSKQILEDFRELLQGPVTGPKSAFQQNQLRSFAEACLVVDSLDSKVQLQLIEWVVDSELVEYKALFQENQDIAWLDKVDKRFSWLKKHLIEFDERLGRIFPPHWEMSERIAVAFCKFTAGELKRIMGLRSQELNVRVLLFAVNKTTAFEHLLAQKYLGLTVSENQLELNHDKPFVGLISNCFEQHLSIYVDAQDKNLSQLIDQFVDDISQKIKQKDTAGQLAEVFPSSGILFTQYKNCLVQCVQLSTGQSLVHLANVFQRNLRDYGQRVLHNYLPKVGSNSLSSTIRENVTNSTSVLSAASSAAGLIQSLLKEGDTRLNKNELSMLCSILLTANYCLETTQQLEKKLQEKADQNVAGSINFSNELDLFHNIISNCIQIVIQDIEAGCESCFITMIKTNWLAAGTPVGPSAYVNTMTSRMQQSFPCIRDNLEEARKYFALLCNKFSATFVPKFISNLYKCKPLNREGAEQLLLDTHTLKKVLLELPTWESVVKVAPSSYTKAIVKGMNKAEIILKVVLIPMEMPVDSLIESSYRLLGPEIDLMEFQKVLDMKGIKRTDSPYYLDLMKKKIKEHAAPSPTKSDHSTHDPEADRI